MGQIGIWSRDKYKLFFLSQENRRLKADFAPKP